MVNSDELIGTTECLPVQARCRINRCRYNRVLLYILEQQFKVLFFFRKCRTSVYVT
jgi:hypothetical protein